MSGRVHIYTCSGTHTLIHTTRLSTGAAVQLNGSWQTSHGEKQSHELKVQTTTLLGENDAEHNPLQPKYQTPEYLRTIPHLRPRIPTNALLLRLRSHVIATLTNFFHHQGYVQCHTPIITSSDCEGAGEVFTVSSSSSSPTNHSYSPTTSTLNPPSQQQPDHFFRTPKYLTVSSQLHLEALAQAVDKVWTLSPTFRAEKSDTPRHLSEFYMLEAELCFTTDLSDLMNLVENLLKTVAQTLEASTLGAEILQARSTTTSSSSSSSNTDTDSATQDTSLASAKTLSTRWASLKAGSFPRLTYAEALSHLQNAPPSTTTNFTVPPTWNTGLQAEHERYLTTTLGPVFITHYPTAQKPFYMLPSSSPSTPTPETQQQHPPTVQNFDLLLPSILELAGGSLREHRPDHLTRALAEKNLSGAGLEWYQDLRRYGSVPHGGFGLGFDRLLGFLAGVPSVRDVVAFPRWWGRGEC